MFMASLRSMVRVLTRNGLFPLFLILLAAYFALPSIIPGETGSFAFEAESIKANRLDILEEQSLPGRTTPRRRTSETPTRSSWSC